MGDDIDYDQQAIDCAAELSALPQGQRNERLDELGRDDPALRARVAALLGQLDDRPAGPAPADVHETPQQPPIERIGPYRLLRRIGSGGMSDVYEAEQDHPRRRVALKLIHPLRLSDSTRRRFEFEVHVLGQLEHPNIARVYDADTAPTNFGPQPYFAMELVRGPRLDEWALATRPSLHSRLQILLDICDAVQHAHQQGIIHRDLKPSNILVTEHAEAKVLDFGIAAIVESGSADERAARAQESLHTATGQLIGTLQYMSPEQATGSERQLDTRSDIYALGVLAYQLLSDRLPYDVSDKPLLEAVQMIRDHEPLPLGKIDRSLSGDLETIVSKAMAKEKSQRYSSVAELAADLRRYLDSEPITARPPSAGYLLGKFAKRHKVVVSAAAAVVTALIVGITFTTIAMLEARRSRLLAVQRQSDSETARQVTDEINSFLNDMLESADPEQAKGGREVTVREVLERASNEISERFSNRPIVEAALRTTIGNTFRSLDVLDQAKNQLTRAIDLRRATLGDDHPDTLTSRDRLALTFDAMGRSSIAEPIHRDIHARRRRVLGESHPQTLVSLNNLACNLDDQGRFAESESLHREALRRRRDVLGDDHVETLQSLHNLGTSLMISAHSIDALPLLRDVVARRERILGVDDPSTIASMACLAQALSEVGSADQAEPVLRDAVVRCRRIFGESHANTLTTTSKWVYALARLSRLTEAEQECSQAIKRGIDALGADHRAVMELTHKLVFILGQSGRFDECEVLLHDLVERGRRLLGDNHPATLVFVEDLQKIRAGGTASTRSTTLPSNSPTTTRSSSG